MDIDCQLGFKGGDYGRYLLKIDGVDYEDLPKAPPITKEDIPAVCRSETIEHIGETVTRVTFQLFNDGVLTPWTAEHNKRNG